MFLRTISAAVMFAALASTASASDAECGNFIQHGDYNTGSKTCNVISGDAMDRYLDRVEKWTGIDQQETDYRSFPPRQIPVHRLPPPPRQQAFRCGNNFGWAWLAPWEGVRFVGDYCNGGNGVAF